MPSLSTSGQSSGTPVRRARRKIKNTELLRLRVDAGFSRDDLAALAGVGRETVRLAEIGFVPTPRVQFKIAKALGRTPLTLWPLETQRGVR